MRPSHMCGNLRKEDVGAEVSLSGWVHTVRDHGGVLFIDLRDRTGITQVVFESGEVLSQGEKARREDCVSIHGKVRLRDPELVNTKIETGEIEVLVDRFERLNESKTPPFEIEDDIETNEEVRNRFRYLDLRRPKLQHHLIARSKMAQAARNFLTAQGFVEIETPLLVKSTPEGARDYIVPSRVHKGKFYALPQSPQIYKQLLMVAGMDRYFQLAKCLRDEDLRADRQPEFTQIDVEMSFPTQEDIRRVAEGLLASIVKESRGVDIELPLPILSYAEAMDRYGSDKPDLRYGLELTTITDIVAQSQFQLAKLAVEQGGIAKCIAPIVPFSRKDLDKTIDYAKECGAKGLAWMQVSEDGSALESNIAKFFSAEQQSALIERTGARPGDFIMIVADKARIANDVLSRIRTKIAEEHGLADPSVLAFCWVLDFPLFEWDESIREWTPAHHMFTMPKEEHLEFLESDPGKVIAQSYDIVLNGVELASGSIRVHHPEIQRRIMRAMKIPEEEAEAKFGFLLEAFRYGAPPHGGFAIGFDRLVAMLLGTQDIREVIAFPKSRSAESLMDGSPNLVDGKQLSELNLKLTEKK